MKRVLSPLPNAMFPSHLFRTAAGLVASLLMAATASATPVVLGPLQNPGNFNRTTFSTSGTVNGSPGFINYGIDLNSQTYNVYLPSNYTPTGTYGLITYIDASDAGTMPAGYQSVLDKYGLIFVAATGIGNTVARSTRAGVAVMGSYRMCELHQIDRSRIYLMGNSGGARLGMDVVYARPDWFSGFIGLSGVSFGGYIPNWEPPGRLQNADPDDDYWPNNPEYYEVSQMITYSGTAYRVPPAPVKVAFQAFHDDFRRTELVGTYRYAFMNHGAAVRLVYRNGGHSSSNANAFDETVRFMQHPYVTVIRDRFEDASLATNTDSANTIERGSGFLNRSFGGGSATEANYSYNSKTQKVLRLTPGGGTATVEAKNRFNWYNPHGIILDVKLRAETQAGDNQQIGIHIARGDSDNTPEDNPGLHVFRNHGGKNRLVLVKANGTAVELARWDYSGTHPMAMTTGDKLFWETAVAPEYAGKTGDFRGEDLRVVADNNGLQLTFSRTVTGLETTFANGVILGSTARTVTTTTSSYYNQSDQEEHPILLQFLWDDMGLRADVEALAFRHWKLLLSNRAFNTSAAAGDALVDELTLIAPAEETNFTGPVITTPGNLSVNATSGQGAVVNFTPSATDDVDGPVPVTCSPSSGTGFPIGTTTVTCSAVDAAGNPSVATFTVTVNANGFTPLPPSAPAAPNSSAGFGFVTLSWSAVPYATTYNVYRSSSPGGALVAVATGISANTFTDTGLVNGTPVYYKTAAVNPAGESPLSGEVSATPVPGTAAKANNMLALDVLNSWNAATVPGPADVALWDETVTDANTTTVGNGVSFSGIRITNPIGNVAINAGAGGNLTLGTQGIDLSASSSNLTIGSGVTVSANQTWATGNVSISVSGNVTGSALVTKTGTGILSFSGNGSAFTGGIAVNAGTLRAGGAAAVFGNGTITLGEAGGGEPVKVDFGIGSSITVANPLVIPAGSGNRTLVSNMGNTNGQTFSGRITGSGNLTFGGGVVTVSGNASAWTGNIFVTGGKLRLANGSSFNTATILSVGSGGTVDLNASGSSWSFAGISNIAGAGGSIANAGGMRTINLRGGGNYAFAGPIQSNINLGINLSGNGSQTLAGNCTYGGTTTVTAGTLIVDGALSSATTVAAAGRLSGNGTLSANVTVNGTLQPGNGIGTSTFGGNLTLGATSRLEWELAANASSGADRVSAATVNAAAGASVVPVFNRSGSPVDFSGPFWSSNQSWTVLSATLMSGSMSLGTVSPDSVGHLPSAYGSFSLAHSPTAVALQWTAYSAIERWRFASFGAIANSGNASDSADPNSDGEPNLLEFATGQSPLAATSFAPSLIPNGGVLDFTYTRSAAAVASGFSFAVEWSDTLAEGSWSGAGVTEQVLSDNGTLRTVRASIPAGAGSRRFVHLRVSKP